MKFLVKCGDMYLIVQRGFKWRLNTCLRTISRVYDADAGHHHGWSWRIHAPTPTVSLTSLSENIQTVYPLLLRR